MSEYMMMPGARLEVGPGGKPYETMGGCSCAPLGAAPGLTPPKGGLTGAMTRMGDMLTRKPPAGGGSPPAGSGSSDNTKYYVAGAAALGLVAVMFLRKKKR